MISKQEAVKREACLKEAIAYIKSKGFGYIKIELEANLLRRATCVECNNRRTMICTTCDGTGVMDVVDDKIVNCKACKEGTIQCTREHKDWGSENACEQFVRSKLPQITHKRLTYARFYHDGSVDSELTFTMPIQHVKDCIEVIKAFTELAKAIGRGCDTRGAGMHIALLNNPTGYYNHNSGNGNSLHEGSLRNFKANMNKLMPALFFLGAADHRSRRLGFRMPRVSSTKYSAINYGHGVLEYRVFETCYARPERLYEFVEVIAKTLQFYGTDVTHLPDSILQAKSRFSAPVGSNLVRFYRNKEVLKALNKTIQYIKPDSRTFEQLKQERGFKLDEKKLTIEASINQRQTEWEWQEYQKRAKVAALLQDATLKHEYENGFKQQMTYKQFVETRVEKAFTKAGFLRSKRERIPAVETSDIIL